MRQLARCVLIIVLGLSLVGCGGQTVPPAPATRPAALPPVQQPTTVEPPSLPADAPAPPTELVVETVLSGLEVPWGMTFSRDGELWLTERPGRIRLGSGDVVLTLTDTAAVGEAGLLGIALHPDFTAEPLVFVYQSYRVGAEVYNRVLRFHYDAASRELNERTVLLEQIPGATTHNGGQLTFGPDGKLYVSTGDAADPPLAQSLDSLAGKVLRLNVDGSIPADNPFPDSPVWSYGHRNPQGFAFHPVAGLYSTEHGSSGLDELNLIEPGQNYGWPLVRGLDHGQYAAPLEVYDPTTPPAAATFYDGPYEPWQGDLFFGTLGFSPESGRHLRRVKLAADGRTVLLSEMLYHNEYGRIRAVAMGPDGCLYFGTSNRDGRSREIDRDDDRIMRICAR